MSEAPEETPARPGPGLVTLCAAATVVIAALGYAWTGKPSAIGAARSAAAVPQEVAQEVAQFAEMIEQLAQRMKSQPEAQGLALLGRSYAVVGQTEPALAAYRQALQMRPDDPGILSDLADLLASRNDGRMEGEAAQLVQRALAASPEHLKALGLAAVAAWQRGDRSTAATHWRRMVTLGPADNPMVVGAQEALGMLKAEGAAAAAPVPVPIAAAPAPAAQVPPQVARAASAAGANATAVVSGPASVSVSVSGRVSLAAPLRSQVTPEDTVFVFARPAQGPRMPLAVLRRQVRDLPFDFKLDDSLAMSPQALLSGATQVVVGARISRTGSATPQAGDLEALSAPVAVGSQGLKLEIAAPVK